MKTPEEFKIERQIYQLHKKGYEDIASAISSMSDVSVKLDLTETNAILKKLIKKSNEPICVQLELV